MPARGSCLESGHFSLDKKGNEEKKGEGLACGTLHSAASPTWGATWSHVGSERCCSRGAGRGREAPATGSSDRLTAEEARGPSVEVGPEGAHRGGEQLQQGERGAGEGSLLVEQDTGENPATALRGEDQTGHKPCVARRVSLCGHQHGPEEQKAGLAKRAGAGGAKCEEGADGEHKAGTAVRAQREEAADGEHSAGAAAEGQPRPADTRGSLLGFTHSSRWARRPTGPTEMGARDEQGVEAVQLQPQKRRRLTHKQPETLAAVLQERERQTAKRAAEEPPPRRRPTQKQRVECDALHGKEGAHSKR